MVERGCEGGVEAEAVVGWEVVFLAGGYLMTTIDYVSLLSCSSPSRILYY